MFLRMRFDGIHHHEKKTCTGEYFWIFPKHQTSKSEYGRMFLLHWNHICEDSPVKMGVEKWRDFQVSYFWWIRDPLPVEKGEWFQKKWCHRSFQEWTPQDLFGVGSPSQYVQTGSYVWQSQKNNTNSRKQPESFLSVAVRCCFFLGSMGYSPKPTSIDPRLFKFRKKSAAF